MRTAETEVERINEDLAKLEKIQAQQLDAAPSTPQSGNGKGVGAPPVAPAVSPVQDPSIAQPAPVGGDSPSLSPEIVQVSREDYEKLQRDTEWVRSSYNREQNKNRSLESQIQILRMVRGEDPGAAAHTPEQPSPPHLPGQLPPTPQVTQPLAEPAQPASPPQLTEEERDVALEKDLMARAQDTLGTDVQEIFLEMQGIANRRALRASTAATEALTRTHIAPLTNALEADIVQQAEIRQETVDQRTNTGLSKKYPGYSKMVNSPQFLEWLESDPMGPINASLLWPNKELGEPGGNVPQMLQIFDRFVEATPDYNPEAVVQAASEERTQAAGATSLGNALLRGETILPKESPAMLLSDLQARFKAVSNKPEELNKLLTEAEKLNSEGRIIDDVNFPQMRRG